MMRPALAIAVTLMFGSGCADTLERAQVAQIRGEYDEAQKLYEDATADPRLQKQARGEFASFLVERAGAEEGRDPDRAEVYYGRALRVQPGHDLALTRWVRLLRKLDRTADAMAVVDNAEASGACRGCKRLRLVLLLDQGDKAMKAKKWDAAISSYEKAQALRKQAAPELAISLAHLQSGRPQDALARLGAAVGLVGNDKQLMATFASIRRELVTIGLSRGDLEFADSATAVSSSDEPVGARYDLATMIAEHVRQKGGRAEALSRYEAMLAQIDGGELSATADQRVALEQKILTVLRYRIAGLLQEGKASEADAVLQQALELRPDDWTFRLQRLLANTPVIGAEKSVAALSSVPEATEGLPQVRAALLSLRAGELLDAGDVEGASVVFEQAKASYEDMPEVHLILAELTATKAPDELSTSDRRVLRRALVPYGNKVRRYAEALGELDWARSELRRLGALYVWYTPWFTKRAAAFEASVRDVYPYDVKFRADPAPVVVFQNNGDDSIELDIYGPEEFEDAYELLPKTSQPVTVPDAGILKLVVDGEARYFLAENYAQVTVPL